MSATLLVPPGLASIDIDASLNVDCRSGAICDFGHTSSLRFGELPDGLAWSSGSGVFVDEIYARYVVAPFMAIARGLAWLDKNIVDYAFVSFSAATKGVSALNGWIDRTFVDGAVNGLANGIIKLGKQGRRIQTGRVIDWNLSRLALARLLATDQPDQALVLLDAFIQQWPRASADLPALREARALATSLRASKPTAAKNM